MSVGSLHGGLNRELCEAVKVKMDRLGDARAMGHLSGRAAIRETCPRERSVLQLTKQEGVGDTNSTLTSDIEIQNFQFASLFSVLLSI